MTIAKPLSAWQSLGVRRADGSDLPTRDLPASLVRADGGAGGDYLVYKNYHAVLRYNCAHHYGLTVGTLADHIGFR
jgi:membrane-bound lytic murein transglycosylase B